MKKKITFFIQDMYSTGGTERVVSLIANELVKKYDVEIISLYKDSDTTFYKLNDKIKLITILNEELNPIKLYYAYLGLKVRKALKNYKTDIFICAGMGMVGLTLFMKERAQYISWEHFNALHGKVGGVMWLGRVLSAKYADKVVVLTQKDMELNKKKFKPVSDIYQIYNPIEKIEGEFKYDINSKKIVTSGRLNSQKGYDILVSVATKVFEKNPDWEWHIYGEGPDRGKISKLISDRNLEKNLKLMGRTNKMNELYNEYSFYVMTSRFEGFAMVNIEAHYARLPIISFDCNCGPDEIIQNGINGYLIDCFDTDKMAEKINYLIENPNIRKKMSDKTLLDKEKLQMENIIKEWEKIL